MSFRASNYRARRRARRPSGCYSHLQRFLAGWHRAGREPSAGPQPLTEESRATDPVTGWQISPIVAASLCITPRGVLAAAQAAKVQALKQASPSFITMRQLAMRFRGLLRSGKAAKLDIGCATPVPRGSAPCSVLPEG